MSENQKLNEIIDDLTDAQHQFIIEIKAEIERLRYDNRMLKYELAEMTRLMERREETTTT